MGHVPLGLVSLFRAMYSGRISPDGPVTFRQTQELIQSILAVMKMELQVPGYTQLCRRQARVNAFTPPARASESCREPLYIVLDSTGLKVSGEGEWKVKRTA